MHGLSVVFFQPYLISYLNHLCCYSEAGSYLRMMTAATIHCAETLFAKIKGVLAVEDDEEDHECAVCFEDLTGDNDLLRVLRACGHPFCKDCLKSIQQVQHSEIRCPLCRVPFQKQDIINPSLVKATIEADTLSSNGTSSSYSSNNLTTNDQEKVAEIPVKVRALLKEMQKVVAKGEKALVNKCPRYLSIMLCRFFLV